MCYPFSIISHIGYKYFQFLSKEQTCEKHMWDNKNSYFIYGYMPVGAHGHVLSSLRFNYFGFQWLAGGGNQETKQWKQYLTKASVFIHHRYPVLHYYWAFVKCSTHETANPTGGIFWCIWSVKFYTHCCFDCYLYGIFQYHLDFLRKVFLMGVFGGGAAEREGRPKRREEERGKKRANIMVSFLMATETPISIKC